MTEERVPYNAGGSKANYGEVGLVLDTFLRPELLSDIVYPTELEGDYQDFDEALRREWYHYTYHALLAKVGMYVSDALNRQLISKEVKFISGRIEAFLKTEGF